MNKLVVIALIVFGGYFGTAYMSAVKEHGAFVKSVEDRVYSVSVTWDDETGVEKLREYVLLAAKKHDIVLEADDIEIFYQRTELSRSQFAANYSVQARVTVTYDMPIIPFYSKSMTFSRSPQGVRSVR